MQEVVERLSDKFASYNQESLITKLGALALFPENHSKKSRLRAALQAAIFTKNKIEQQNFITDKVLANLLEQHFTSEEQIWQYEDPQEVMFTDIIQFHGGNFIIFPEVLADSHNALKLLLETIFMEGTKFPKSFKQEIYYAVSTLLNISNVIANKMEYKRYQNSPDSHHKLVFFPETYLMRRASNAIQFSYELIVAKTHKGFEEREKTISSFICDEKSKFIETDDFNRNPLQTKPFSKFGNSLIVNQVSVIPVSLVHFIILKIFEYKIYDGFLTEYRKVLKSNIDILLIRLGLKPTHQVPVLSKSHPLHNLEILSKIDDNKLMFITILPDLFQAYNKDIFFSLRNELVSSKILQGRKGFIAEYVQNTFIAHEVLFLDIYIPIGREYRIVDLSQSFNHINLSISDLINIAYHDSGNKELMLWNYFMAERNFLNHSSIIAFSMLDKYAFYSQNHQSFYFTDDARYPNVTLEIGLANDFREEAYRKIDSHLVLYDYSDRLVEVERRFPYKEIDIYIPIDVDLLPRQYVLGEKLSFWIYVNIEDTNDPGVRKIAWSILEACSFWIWQISPELQPYAKDVKKGLIHFQFNLIDQQKWAIQNFDENIKPHQVSKLFVKYLNGNTINIDIPFEFTYLINGKNNNNDIVLIEWILNGINLFLEQKGSKSKLDIGRIVGKYCPVGKKTMILSFDTIDNPMLHYHKLPTKRLISSFHVEHLLNDLALKAAPGYPLGDLITQREKNKLCHAVVAYYFKTLQELISFFHASDLIYKTVGLCEALWRSKHISAAKATSMLACFGQVSTLRDEILEEGLKIDEASVALRCLIEIIIATPPCGKKILNNSDIDEMLALTKEIITWGALSEEINLGVNDIKLGILPSGRLATDKKFLFDSLRPYNIAKRNEELDDRIEEEEAIALGVLKKDLTITAETEFLKQKAYLAEFNYPWDEILDILIAIMGYGYEQDDGVIIYEKNLLISDLKTRLNHDDVERIEYVLDTFSLKERASWDEIPYGYKRTDIYPWRYSRALSYMRKPLLQLISNNIVYYYWGMRQILLSWQYISDLIDNGRYTYKTKEMGQYIGHMLNIKGKIFTQRVYEWLNITYSSSEYIIDHEVKIDKKGKIIADINLGDIDILIIIPNKKRIISIECKSLNPARITSEFASELKKFESDWIGKHLKRHKWLQNNLVELGKSYNIVEAKQYELRSIFLTSEKVPYPYIRKTYKTLPFYDFSTWKRNIKLLDEM